MRFFVWFFSLMLGVSAPAAELHFDFARYAAGTTPTNFHAALAGTGAPPVWKIVEADVPSAFTPFTSNAPAFNRVGVLTQVNPDMGEEHFPMFIYDGKTFGNFTFGTQFKIVSGIAEQMAGLVFRFQNSSNFYVARVSSLGHNVRFYKVVDGIRSPPIGPMMNVPSGQWHNFSVECEGNQITVRLDGKLVMPPLQDSTFREGKIGFWTMSDSLTYFANGEVDYKPLVPPVQQMVNNLLESQSRILDLRIYTLQTNDTTRVIAAKTPKEIGQAGSDPELKAIQDGTTFFGRERDAVLVALPLRDRNGDIIAAMRVKLKTFFGETQDNAVMRGMMIRKKLEAVCTSADDLKK